MTGVQTCALPIWPVDEEAINAAAEKLLAPRVDIVGLTPITETALDFGLTPEQETGVLGAALELVAAGGVDLVVSDFNMPGRTGLSLAADLRRLAPRLPLTPGARLRLPSLGNLDTQNLTSGGGTKTWSLMEPPLVTDSWNDERSAKKWCSLIGPKIKK